MMKSFDSSEEVPTPDRSGKKQVHISDEEQMA